MFTLKIELMLCDYCIVYLISPKKKVKRLIIQLLQVSNNFITVIYQMPKLN